MKFFGNFKIELINGTISIISERKILHELIYLAAHYETLSNGQNISVGAAVGLLSHNIKIIGQDYDNLYKESYGARVLVGLVVDKGQTYAGMFHLHKLPLHFI